MGGCAVFAPDGFLVAMSAKHYRADTPTNNAAEYHAVVDIIRLVLELDLDSKWDSILFMGNIWLIVSFMNR